MFFYRKIATETPSAGLDYRNAPKRNISTNKKQNNMKKSRTTLMLAALLTSALWMTGCTKEDPEPEQVQQERQEPVAAKSGVFSVAEDCQVRFAPGNLARGGRTLVAHQYDYGGYFGWGTGNNPGLISTHAEDYCEYNEWGDHFEGHWRTLSRDEWYYLLNTRPNAADKQAPGSIDTIHGFILLPDAWTMPEGCSFSPGATGWETNSYSPSQWKKMEDGGAVFLPAAGYRYGEGVSDAGLSGYYWTSTPENSDQALGLTIHSGGARADDWSYRYYGLSVRLAQNS